MLVKEFGNSYIKNLIKKNFLVSQMSCVFETAKGEGGFKRRSFLLKSKGNKCKSDDRVDSLRFII